MQKLMLAGNKLSALPAALSQCRNLSLLRISANRLTTLPTWLLTMPRLSWLATSGNLFSYQPKAVSVPLINWQLLQTEHVLGQGASGIIYKGKLQQGRESKEVAIKLFKGDVTSDGLPEDELNAFIAAGNHEGLSQLIGQITDHPEGKKGVVMELMDKRFYNLGLPPSFESCTRDVFTNCKPISAAQAVKVATTIASAAGHLHSMGIMHGDLYAHNTLIDDDGNTLLSDFGAASFYDVTNTETAKATERIEVSAFGCLLDDLLQLNKDTTAPAIIARLETLRDAAMAPAVRSRPDFNYLHNELLQLQRLV
jgi:serine/threonine protein kinase